MLHHSPADAATHRHARHGGHAARHAFSGSQRNEPASPIETEFNANWQQIGVASYYGPRHHGHRTASGTIYDQTQLTAAHPWLPFGTRIRVTVQSTGRQVMVTITDRSEQRRRIIDLSVGAAEALGIMRQGTAIVVLSAV